MKWASAFKYLPINYGERIATVKKLTQKVSFDNNLNGEKIRLRLSNRYAKVQIRFDRVTIGTVCGEEVRDTVPVTLAGSSIITLLPGQEIFSDEIEFDVRAGRRLAVSFFIEEEQTIESVCCLKDETNVQVTYGTGDRTDGEKFDKSEPDNIWPFLHDVTSPNKMMFFYGFDALQVYTDDDVKIVAAFGDSITHMSYVTNELERKLYASYPGRVTLINSGVGGNRLTHDAIYMEEIHQVIPAFGKAGIRRFEKDVFEIDPVDSVLSVIGINDILLPFQAGRRKESETAENIISGFRRIAEIAHVHNSKIYAASIMPAGNEDFPPEWLPAIEKTRLQINEWIRDENDFDGCFDFDAAVRDALNPGYLLPGVHLGDGLHPNGRGAQLIVSKIDIEKLTGLRREDFG